MSAPAPTPAPIVLPTPGVDSLLLIRKAITAKPFSADVASAGGDGGCAGQSTELHRKPFIIGVTGGTASGKTTVCDEIARHLGARATLLQMDRFYKTLPAGKCASEHNFDIPDAFDWPLFIETLQKLSTGQSVQVPQYSFATHQRQEKWDTFAHADVILVEGILVLHDPRIREQFDLKVFVEADADTRLARRIQRDIRERNREVDGIIAQYLRTVKPAHEQYIGPTIRYADIIVPWHDGPHNNLAIEILVQHIGVEVHKRGVDADTLAKIEAEELAKIKSPKKENGPRTNL